MGMSQLYTTDTAPRDIILTPDEKIVMVDTEHIYHLYDPTFAGGNKEIAQEKQKEQFRSEWEYLLNKRGDLSMEEAEHFVFDTFRK